MRLVLLKKQFLNAPQKFGASIPLMLMPAIFHWAVFFGIYHIVELRCHCSNSLEGPGSTACEQTNIAPSIVHCLYSVTNVFPAVYTAMLKHLRLVDLKYTYHNITSTCN